VALLIHASREARSEVGEYLERTGFTVAAVPSPDRARDWIEEADGPVDLLVMPDGLQAGDAEVVARTVDPAGPVPAVLRLGPGPDQGPDAERFRDETAAVVEPPFTLRGVTRGVWSALQPDPGPSEAR